ncbi:hypothetical protein MSSIT_0270 [Methanosarcina siciliae T4/M]|uniref:Uncharacterized protein n=2 Tax=Methanosarcina siciliae TaxID=38027 RepID=A0A0E3P0V8_9EURY|nr:hypothetical protein MSSIT_0270 [Methanosarcina siciliae T4/M]
MRNKLPLDKVCLVIILGLAMVIFFSGCAENKVSAAEELNTSSLLINNADLKVESAISDMDDGTYTSAKSKLKAARVDYEEALKILNNASSDYEEETQYIERYTTFAEVGLDSVNSSENIVLATEHLDKCIAYLSSEDLDLSRKELHKANEALNNSIVYLRSAKEKISPIDPDSVPVEEKSYIIILKDSIETSEKMGLELKEITNGMYPYLDGAGHLFDAEEYLKAEEWDKAADEFANSSVKFSESKKSLEKLKDSEYSEISVGAIEICGVITQFEKDLPCLEAGCRYMENGSYYQANAEFSKLFYLSSI